MAGSLRCGEGISLFGFGRDQDLADFGIEPDLVINGTTIGCKLPLMLVARLAEEHADQPVVQLQCLVRQRRQGVEKIATRVAYRRDVSYYSI